VTRKLIIHDGKSERELVLIGTLTVGRDPSCHISDLDPLLSRRHAEFVTGKSGCTVRDLGSRNGMLVNGLKVREQLLKEGDLVQLGHLQLRYSEIEIAATPDAARLASATTAHEVATVAVHAPRAALEDTRPHPPNAHPGGDDDGDATRAGGTRKDDDPTMAPRGAHSHLDDTAVPVRRGAPAPAAEAEDLDATRIPGARPAALKETAAMPNTDFDATGLGRPNEALAAALAGNLDQTIAPGTLDLDATFVTAAPPEARLTAGADLRITAASPGCRAHFDSAPEALVGRPLGDVLAERLTAAAAGGPSELTLAVDRSPVDRSLIVILKAAQVETVS
jgi:hypothetical protein